MATPNKVIITCAVTGAIHTPTMSPYLPITPQEIAQPRSGPAEAAPRSCTCMPATQDRKARSAPGGIRPVPAGHQAALQRGHQFDVGRLADDAGRGAREARRSVQARGASLNMGSMNFALFPMLNRYKSFKFDWEEPYLEGTRDLIFRNTFRDIEFVLKTCQNNDTRFEFECYDIAHLYNLAHFLDRGLVKPPLFVQSVFGILGGIGTIRGRDAHAPQCRPPARAGELPLVGAGRRRSQMPIAALAASMGGNVRVGLEDSLWIGPGKLAESNAQQVSKARQIIEGLGLEIASLTRPGKSCR